MTPGGALRLLSLLRAQGARWTARARLLAIVLIALLSPPAALAAGDTYWIVPNGNVSWYWAGGGFNAAPTEQNGSGYEWAGTLTATDTYFMSGSSTVPGYSISINPVPEPASMGIAGLALVGAAVALRRRGAAAK